MLCEGQLLRAFEVQLSPGSVDPASSEVGGDALIASAPGEHRLTFRLFDRHGNATEWPAAPGGVRVLLTAPRGQAEGAAAAAAAATGGGADLQRSPSSRAGLGGGGAGAPFECVLTARPEPPLLLPLHEVGTYYLTITLEPSEEQIRKNAFLADKDGNGVLDEIEYRDLLRKIGMPIAIATEYRDRWANEHRTEVKRHPITIVAPKTPQQQPAAESTGEGRE